MWHAQRNEVYRVFWWENRKQRVHLEDTEKDGKMILKRSRMGKYGLDSSDSGQGPVVGCGESANETLGSMTCRVPTD